MSEVMSSEDDMQSKKAAEVKRDFGSFHSSNVEELIGQDEASYAPPSWKDTVAFDASRYASLGLCQRFGSEELKRALFYLSDEFTFLNHGAFGLSFKPVVEYVHAWRVHGESQPLRFYDRQIMPLLVDITRLYAKRVFACPPNELTLVDNCTFAFASVLSSLQLAAADQIFIFSTTYGAYKKRLKEECASCDARLVEVTIDFPIVDSADLRAKTVAKLAAALAADGLARRLRCVFVDHVPSNQPFVMPVEEMAALVAAERPDICFIVDAAHTLGSFDRVNTQNIDIMFANCHKWFCGPKGTAFLYRSERARSKLNLRPVVQSHGINAGFNSEFIWLGLKDYAVFLGLYACLTLWTECLGGMEHAVAYCRQLSRRAGEMLANAWHTDFLVAPELCSTMLCVRLPDSFVAACVLLAATGDTSDMVLSYDEAELVQNFLYHSHRIEVPVKCVAHKLYVRISAHVYNKLADYEILMRAVLDTNRSSSQS